MRINNVSTSTSYQSVIIMSIITSIVTIALLWGYINCSKTGISFDGFIQWIFEIFQTLRAEMTDDPFIPWLFVILVFGSYIGLIIAVISRYNALAKFNSGVNVKYINFLPTGIEFFFTKPENNFNCAYEDITKLYMDIQSTLVRTKNGSYIAFQQMNLYFSVNDKKYKVSNTTYTPIRQIYKIIDWTRKVQHFEYGFSGAGEIPDYREKIDEYLKLGYKDIAGKEGESKLKLMSLLFFIVGIIFLISFADIFTRVAKYSGSTIIFLPFTLFLIISFICDIILVVDKIRDNKYRGYNE